ncbi:DUF4097 family beta strand repeat-containing protein [Alkalimonas collagenimarina]|uniref:DUF4097 family beta strand repeat-containing protein n=1 Tax=Alkalimonas collagenimarina TaxID=400390 RepID=A0ABT9GY03_9GAMM|nr:DUF4097 family beta strand repeat-containing protein [Alkalimonas collagenimarina]MDP4535935.1 DUF4097 family beta strand repeat-containing protein [Alkalimonas collagenimarina]
MWKLALAILALSSGSVLANERCEYSSEQQVTLNDVQRLQLTMSSDQLKLVGGSGDQVAVTARLCASSQKRLDELRLDTRQQGQSTQLQLLPERRSNQFSSGLFGRGGSYAWFDLTIEVPASILLDLTLSSGSASVENIAGLELVLSSGRVQANDIAGPVSGSVSSGQLTITEAGPVQLNALSSGQVRLHQVGSVQASSVSSGQLSIETAAGDVTLASLSSGQMRASDVHGSVKVDRISSGSVRVSDVKGNAEFGSIGSGSIRAERIDGDLSLERKGSGSVRHQDVGGQVRLPSR